MTVTQVKIVSNYLMVLEIKNGGLGVVTAMAGLYRTGKGEAEVVLMGAIFLGPLMDR